MREPLAAGVQKDLPAIVGARAMHDLPMIGRSVNLKPLVWQAVQKAEEPNALVASLTARLDALHPQRSSEPLQASTLVEEYLEKSSISRSRGRYFNLCILRNLGLEIYAVIFWKIPLAPVFCIANKAIYIIFFFMRPCGILRSKESHRRKQNQQRCIKLHNFPLFVMLTLCSPAAPASSISPERYRRLSGISHTSQCLPDHPYQKTFGGARPHYLAGAVRRRLIGAISIITLSISQ